MVRVISLIRFSFLSSTDNGYRLAKGGTLAERGAALFDSARLDRRFAIFEGICLPSLRLQPPEKFHAIILASSLMPDAYKARLLTAVGGMRNLSVAFEEPAAIPYEDLWLRHIRRLDNLAPVFATTRLDDDDAIGARFTDDLTVHVQEQHVGFAVSFPLGLQASHDGGQAKFWESDWPMNGAALAFITRREEMKTIYSCGHHHLIARSHPVIVDARAFQYIVSNHQQNDSLVSLGRPARRRHALILKLKGLVRPGRHAAHARDRRMPETAWSIEEAAEKAPGLAPLLRDCDWTALMPGAASVPRRSAA